MKSNELSDFKMVKIGCILPDCAPSLVYDVLHDSEYRKTWDQVMLEGREVCYVDDHCDIGYYALKMPKPLRHRDFVTMRSWRASPADYIIMNHSINHKQVPARKGFIRGISYLTGYHLLADGPHELNQPGCDLVYVTQSDPKGRLPAWVVNNTTKYLAPRVAAKLAKACRDYASWKKKQGKPDYKPWLNVGQVSLLPRLDSRDILSMDEVQNEEVIDETTAAEEANGANGNAVENGNSDEY